MYTVQYRRPFPPADLSESKMWWCGDDSWIAANKITEILCQPHVWRDNVICKVGHFAIALRAYCIVYTNEKPENLIKLMKLCAAQPASLPPLKILEQKAIAPLRAALTETSTKTTHRWNLQSPYYLRSRSSFQTIAFENPDWPTHPICTDFWKGKFLIFSP